MKINFKNVFNLTKLFIKDSSNNMNLFKDGKLNKSSPWIWIILILFLSISCLSFKIIDYLNGYNQQEIFLNFYVLFLNILLFMQTILVGINIYYFSKDLEVVLPLPFKSIEILFAKFFTILFYLYRTVILIGLIPMVNYGIVINSNLIYFLKLILILIILPIIINLLVSILIMLGIKLFMKIKNKDLLQNIFTLFLMIFLFAIFALVFYFTVYKNNINQLNLILQNINSYLFIDKISINFLSKNLFFDNLINFIYLILIGIIFYFIYFFVGKKLYLKNVLKISFYYKNKKNKKINLKKELKKNKKDIAYLKREFKSIFKNPLFSIQCLYPICIYTAMISVLLVILLPRIIAYGNSNNLFYGLVFDIECICVICGAIQILGLTNKLSVTSISREGKSGFILKTMPINLYKQFIYKNIPQIFFNSIFALIILVILFLEIKAINYLYIIPLFLISILFFIINSNLLSIVDLLMPKNNWNAEHEIFKNNKNILIQYLLMIINVGLFYFFYRLFFKHNLNKSLIIFILFLIIFIIIYNIIIYKLKNKLFRKIN